MGYIDKYSSTNVFYLPYNFQIALFYCSNTVNLKLLLWHEKNQEYAKLS